jgi:hypothetical protein
LNNLLNEGFARESDSALTSEKLLNKRIEIKTTYNFIRTKPYSTIRNYPPPHPSPKAGRGLEKTAYNSISLSNFLPALGEG